MDANEDGTPEKTPDEGASLVTPQKPRKTKFVVPRNIPVFSVSGEEDPRAREQTGFPWRGTTEAFERVTSPIRIGVRERKSLFGFSDEDCKGREAPDTKIRRSSLLSSAEYSSPLSNIVGKRPEDIFTEKTALHNTDSETDDEAFMLEPEYPWKNPTMHSLGEEYFTGEERDDLSMCSSSLHVPASFFSEAFEDVTKIGEGCFSEVFRVRCRETGRVSAVKRIQKEYLGVRDRNQRLSEIKNMWQCRSVPHCLQIINAWEQSGHCFIETEFCAMGTLEDEIQQCRLTGAVFGEERLYLFLFCVSSALEGMHVRGIVHGDVKPANILVSHDGFKLGDFGLSHDASLGSETEGDRCYMAPEAMETSGFPSDVFSLGMTALAALVPSMVPGTSALWHDLRGGDLNAAGVLPASRRTETLLFQMLSPQPEARPSAADVFSVVATEKTLKEAEQARAHGSKKRNEEEPCGEGREVSEGVQACVYSPSGKRQHIVSE
ncbi:MAG: WEE protein kinase [Amphiamblys sp. WSBS2006]|nr:MAG: WEE protein kinase [Amphiamblys sp. WSBS2006]